MPGIQGSEFLQKSIQYVPLATRVIITGHTNPKDIIEAINQAHAYMYMTKPLKKFK
jgi:response regulator RpfG family c-di-GMP phosphodiesterase